MVTHHWPSVDGSLMAIGEGKLAYVEASAQVVTVDPPMDHRWKVGCFENENFVQSF